MIIREFWHHHVPGHPLLLQVLISFIFAKLHDVVFSLTPSLVQVNACKRSDAQQPLFRR
jgi:hypothetical protein